MPAGAPPAASQGGNRCSNGRMSALPTGERPSTARRTRLATTRRRPARPKRVGHSNRPRMPIETMRLEGMAKKPMTFEATKNMRSPGSLLGFLPRLVARLGLVVHGVEAGELGAALDLADDPGLHALVLGALLGDEADQVLRDHHRAVVVADDDVAGKDRAAATGDRPLPADESETVDGGRRRRARTPDRQLGSEHAGLVADDTVGHQRGDV